ncbi:MAG TPA: hypothetical protein VGS19_37325, partial [Streptosporangiaceae bacterium]|nr:hypothetical protein [Streptosporangiaceae bacterium]
HEETGGHGRQTASVPIRSADLSIRSAERRRWSAELDGPGTAGLVLHGAPGIGKSVLASEIIARVGHEPGRITTVINGEVTADAFLASVTAALRRHPGAPGWTGSQARALDLAGRNDLPWDRRIAMVRERILGQVPVLVGLDDFDGNLSLAGGRWTVRDPALAGLLTDWASAPHLGRLLLTCRHEFVLPGAAEQALGFRRVGPLSGAGLAELASSLPALSELGEQELDRAWRLLGGHPGATKYLDSLLAAFPSEFPELARRLTLAIQTETGQGGLYAEAPTGMPTADADRVAGIAGDLLLGELYGNLSEGARHLLTGTSVYRTPVGCHVLLLPAGHHSEAAGLGALVSECQAAGLLSVDPGYQPPTVFVHRWTACGLHRLLAAARRDSQVTEAHRRAAEYWRSRISAWPQDRDALLEASYHLLQASDLVRQDHPAPKRTHRGGLRRARLAGVAATVAAVGVTVFLATRAASAPLAARPVPPSPAPTLVDKLAIVSAAVRSEAAAWVAHEVSTDAIVACDPGMCAILQAHGIAAADLVVLRPSTPGPLGSDVVVATAAVRSQFGARLMSVYAPEVIASFGAGELRIDVRAIAPDGAAAYRDALAYDLTARRAAGQRLLRNPRISFSAAARRVLVGGQVDPRLLTMLAAMASTRPVQVLWFGDSGPDASQGTPLRAAGVRVPGGAGGSATLRDVLAFAQAQRPPYLPARAVIVSGPDGSSVLDLGFSAPSPVGLLKTQPHHLARGQLARHHLGGGRGRLRGRCPKGARRTPSTAALTSPRAPTS